MPFLLKGGFRSHFLPSRARRVARHNARMASAGRTSGFRAGGGGRRRSRLRRGAKRGRRRATPGTGLIREVFEFKVCHTFNLIGDASVVTDEAVFSLNDPTDFLVIPSGTVQPNGWEERAAFFEKAKVVSVSANVRMEKRSTDIKGVVFGLVANLDSTANHAAIIWTNWCAFPRTQHRHLPGVIATGSTESNRVTRMSYHVKPHKMFFQPMRSERFEIGLPDTSPTDRVFLHVLMSTTDQAVLATSTSAICTITIRWKVLFYDRRNLIKSADA